MPGRALLVIDAQRIYTSPDSEMYCKQAAATIAKINAVIADSNKRGDFAVVVRHEHRSDGSDLGRMFDYLGEEESDFNFKQGSDEVLLDADLRVPSKATQLTKTRYSAFVGTSLDSVLRSNAITSLTICGFMTNFCCEATARHGHDLDYFVDFIADATGTPGTEKQTQKQLRERTSDTLAAGYARIWTAKRWCARRSGKPGK